MQAMMPEATDHSASSTWDASSLQVLHVLHIFTFIHPSGLAYLLTSPDEMTFSLVLPFTFSSCHMSSGVLELTHMDSQKMILNF